jgi:hypothetical protein
MLKQWPTLDITCSNWDHVWAQVDQVKSHLIQSVKDNIAKYYDIHRFEFAAECLEFIDSLQGDNKYLFPLAEHGEGGVRGRNPMYRVGRCSRMASVLFTSWW